MGKVGANAGGVRATTAMHAGICFGFASFAHGGHRVSGSLVNAKITSFGSKYRSFCDFFDGYPSFDMLSILGIKDFLRLQCVEFKISVLCVATPRRDLHAFKPEVRIMIVNINI